jgi:hypothetical protein
VIIGSVVAGIVAIDVAGGHGASDSINATRVLVRFVVLGILLATCFTDLPTLPRIVLAAIVVAGVVQMGFGLFEAASDIAGGRAVILVGTTGRYDRFGLIVAASLLALLALVATRPSRWQLPLIAAASVMLFLSTSRQSMLAVAVTALIVVVWPHVHRRGRVLAVCLSLACLAMILVTTNRGDFGAGAGDEVVAVPSSPPRELGSTSISTAATGNIRLYLNVVLGPWAALQEPVVGLGPGRHDQPDADPRLIARVETDGVRWADAQQFMNDSNYASMFVQFGLLAPLGFLVLMFGMIAIAAQSAWRRPDALGLFAVMFGCAALLAATIGPSFEIRPTSLILWTALFVVVAWRDHPSTA